MIAALALLEDIDDSLGTLSLTQCHDVLRARSAARDDDSETHAGGVGCRPDPFDRRRPPRVESLDRAITEV